MAAVMLTDLPEEGIADYVAQLARKHGVKARRTSLDALAEVVTRLSDDDVRSDATSDTLLALTRADVISQDAMLSLLTRHLNEKFDVRSVR